MPHIKYHMNIFWEQWFTTTCYLIYIYIYIYIYIHIYIIPFYIKPICAPPLNQWWIRHTDAPILLPLLREYFTVNIFSSITMGCCCFHTHCDIKLLLITFYESTTIIVYLKWHIQPESSISLREHANERYADLSPKGAKVYPASRRRSNKRVGLKGQLAPHCVPWLKNSIMAYKRLSTSLGSKTLNNTSSLGLGGTKI